MDQWYKQERSESFMILAYLFLLFEEDLVSRYHLELTIIDDCTHDI